MNEKPTLSKITIYPIKSLDGMSLEKAIISEGGCLLHDREFSITDGIGNFIIGKTNPLVHNLRSKVDFDQKSVSFRTQGNLNWDQFHLLSDKKKIEAYLSDYFGLNTILQQNKTGRFLDVPDTSGMTILSTSSLETVSKWYSFDDLEETRMRFRATLEIAGVSAFWEDQLFSKEGRCVEFKIGDATVLGISPRARCVVPSRNPKTGDVTKAFPKIFAKERAASLPDWSEMEAYSHYYHLSVDCLIPETEIGKTIQIGDLIRIIGERVF